MQSPRYQPKVIALGAVTLQLLEIVGLLLAGGLLLLWVAYKMYRELRHDPSSHAVQPVQRCSLVSV